MTIALRATPSAITTGTTTTLTLTIDAATQGQDWLLLIVSDTTSVTLPTGWTQLDAESGGTAQPTLFATKQAAGSAGSGSSDASTTVAVTVAGSRAHGVIVTVSGTSPAFAAPQVLKASSGGGAIGVPDPVPDGGLAVYWGTARVASQAITLSRGTTDVTRSADTIASAVLGHEAFATAGVPTQTFTPGGSPAGYLYAAVPVIEQGGAGDAPGVSVVAASGTAASYTGHVYKGRASKALDTSGVA